VESAMTSNETGLPTVASKTSHKVLNSDSDGTVTGAVSVVKAKKGGTIGRSS